MIFNGKESKFGVHEASIRRVLFENRIGTNPGGLFQVFVGSLPSG